MHVERAREFFLSAKEHLDHLPEGNIFSSLHDCAFQIPNNRSISFLIDSISLSIHSNKIQLNRPPAPLRVLCFLCIGEKNEFRLAEGLNCMAMYAMGVESCAEVLVYLNRALDICNYNRAVNG